MYKCNHCNITIPDNQADGHIVKVGPKNNPKFYCVEWGEPVTYIPDVPKTEGIFHGAQATLISNSDNRITTNNYYGGMPDEQVETPYGTCLKRDTRFCKQCRQWIPLTFYNAERGMCDNCIELQGAKAFEEGKNFLEDGLYDEALSEFLKFEPICKEAKVLAELQYNIGYCFYKQEQWKDACKYFIKSSDLVPDSLYYRALCFYYGYGVTKSKEKAYDLLKKANLHGSPKALEFMEGIPLFPVERDGKVGYIDDEGNIVIQCHWKEAKYFSEELAPVKAEYKWGFINKLGEIVISYKWLDVDFFSNELAAVLDDNYKWGFINKSGENIIPCKWDVVGRFHEGIVQVDDNNGWGCINKSGEIIIPCEWYDIGCFYDGLATVEDFKRGLGFINKRGEIVIQCDKWTRIKDFHEGLAAVEIKKDIFNYEYGFINKLGEIIIPYKWKDVHNFSEGFAAVLDDNSRWGFINTSGENSIPCKWKVVRDFHEGLTAVIDDNQKYGFINKQGDIVLSCKWKIAFDFYEGRALVKDENDNWKFVNKGGDFVMSCNLKVDLWNIWYLSGGLLKVKDKNGKEYYINKKGTIIAETGF